MVKRIWNKTVFILTLHCDRAEHLASDALDRRLDFHQRAALRMHTLICRSCRHFRRQLRLLHVACRDAKLISDGDGGLQSMKLDDEAKARLLQGIRARDN